MNYIVVGKNMASISRLSEKLNSTNTGLVLFDTLNGYLHSGIPEKEKFLAERQILQNMQRLLKKARSSNLVTFYPIGQHMEGGTDTVSRLTDTDMELKPIEAKETPIKPGFYKGTDAANIAPELAPINSDVVVPKHRWNSFFQTDLEFALRVRGLENIILAGGSTDVGIASTAFAARDLDFGLVIVSDCCYSMRGNNNEFFLERVFPRMGRVMDTDKVISLIS